MDIPAAELGPQRAEAPGRSGWAGTWDRPSRHPVPRAQRGRPSAQGSGRCCLSCEGHCSSVRVHWLGDVTQAHSRGPSRDRGPTATGTCGGAEEPQWPPGPHPLGPCSPGPRTHAVNAPETLLTRVWAWSDDALTRRQRRRLKLHAALRLPAEQGTSAAPPRPGPPGPPTEPGWPLCPTVPRRRSE